MCLCEDKFQDVHSKRPPAPPPPHSKSTRVKCHPERVHWGHTQFRVNDDPEIGQLAPEYDPELGQSYFIICQICRKLTKFWVTFDPELGPTPMDPFPGHVDQGVFRVPPSPGLVRNNLAQTVHVKEADFVTDGCQSVCLLLICLTWYFIELPSPHHSPLELFSKLNILYYSVNFVFVMHPKNVHGDWFEVGHVTCRSTLQVVVVTGVASIF